MPLLPSYTAEYSTQEITETFAGLNRNLKIGDGEFNDTCNLSTEYYPLLSCRGRRGYVKDLTAPMGLIAKTKLAYVDGGTLYCTHQPCVICCKMIINAGIRRVVYKYGYPDEFSIRLFREANIEVVQLNDEGESRI